MREGGRWEGGKGRENTGSEVLGSSVKLSWCTYACVCICITCIYAHTHIYIHCSVSNLTRYNQSLKSKKLYILKPSSSTPNNAKNSSTTCGKEQKQNKNTNGVIGSVSGTAVWLSTFTVWFERTQSLGSLGWQGFYYLGRGVCTAGSRSKTVDSDPIPDCQQWRVWAQSLPLVWVSHGCSNKRPQTEQFKKQKCILSQFWKPEVQTQGTGKAKLPPKVLREDLPW